MIKVAFTSDHGIINEIRMHPPERILYSVISPKDNPLVFEHPFLHYSSDSCDLIESFDFPCFTNNKWICQCYSGPGLASFNIFGSYYNRKVRVEIIKKLLLKDNFKKLIMGSNAGLWSLKSYAGLTEKELLDKVCVVYPAVRRVDDSLLKKDEDNINLLFCGHFIVKGGAHVVDAFERLQKRYDNISLQICSKDTFHCSDHSFKELYMKKIADNKDISFGYYSREQMFSDIFPGSHIFLNPTYGESYGFAMEEAMAHAMPVISTNHFAIPEIVEQGKNGFLIDINDHPFIRDRAEFIQKPSKDFHNYMSDEVYKHLSLLIEDANLRKKMGLAGLNIARSKFSFDRRNRIMKEIYESAVSNS